MTRFSDLSDTDLMLNLYFSVIMALHVTGAEAATVEMSVTRMTDTDETEEEIGTLQDLMTEVEHRLGIEPGDVDAIVEGRMQ